MEFNILSYQIPDEVFIFMFTVVFAFFSYLRFAVAGRSLFLTSFLFLPATFLHELSHFIMGTILFAKPVSFSILPKKEGDRYILGNVSFKNINFFNAFPTAMAPTLLYVVLFFFDKVYFEIVKENIVWFLIFVYVNFTLVYSALPSIQDFKVAFSKIGGVIFWLLIVSFFFYKDILLAVGY